MPSSSLIISGQANSFPLSDVIVFRNGFQEFIDLIMASLTASDSLLEIFTIFTIPMYLSFIVRIAFLWPAPITKSTSISPGLALSSTIDGRSSMLMLFAFFIIPLRSFAVFDTFFLLYVDVYTNYLPFFYLTIYVDKFVPAIHSPHRLFLPDQLFVQGYNL